MNKKINKVSSMDIVEYHDSYLQGNKLDKIIFKVVIGKRFKEVEKGYMEFRKLKHPNLSKRR